MLRAGLITVALMGISSTSLASDRVRVFVTYDSGGYYDVGYSHRHHHHSRDCRDHRHWFTRDGGYRYGYAPRYGWDAWSFGWSSGWDGRRDRDRRHWNSRDGRHDYDRQRDRGHSRGRDGRREDDRRHPH